jgi:hypothetical protein
VSGGEAKAGQPRTALADLQRWFQSAVVGAEAPQDADAARVILPSPTLRAAERVAIYHGMYPLRMHDALASDYPALQHFLGNHGFEHFVADYVERFPSRAYTLNRLGDHVPEFIASSALPKREFLHDLARLELAISEVFDAEEVATLSTAEIEAMPPGAWEKARLEAVPAFRLLALRYPVNDYLQSVKDDNHDHPQTNRKDTWVAIHRRAYSMYRLDLVRPAYELLKDITGGATLGEAIDHTLARRGRSRPSAEELSAWFRDWVGGGTFRALR